MNKSAKAFLWPLTSLTTNLCIRGIARRLGSSQMKWHFVQETMESRHFESQAPLPPPHFEKSSYIPVLYDVQENIFSNGANILLLDNYISHAIHVKTHCHSQNIPHIMTFPHCIPMHEIIKLHKIKFLPEFTIPSQLRIFDMSMNSTIIIDHFWIIVKCK